LEVFGWLFTGRARGIAFALILELFLAVMMATRLTTTQGRYHWGNAVLYFVAAVTVAVIGFGTWQGIIEGNETRFTVSESLQRRIVSAKEALGTAQQNKRLFGCRAPDDQPIPDCRPQRGNLAKAVNEERRLTKRLEKLEDQTGETTATGAVQFWFLAVAKFTMLAANMVSLWLIGRLARGRKDEYSDLVDAPQDVLEESIEPEPGMVQLPPREALMPPVVERPRLRPRFIFWTKEDFLYHFKMAKATSESIMAATGLNAAQLSVVINHTHKVLNFIRSRREHETAKSRNDTPQEAGEGDQQSDGDQVGE
jgi:hypothetical protein